MPARLLGGSRWLKSPVARGHGGKPPVYKGRTLVSRQAAARQDFAWNIEITGAQTASPRACAISVWNRTAKTRLGREIRDQAIEDSFKLSVAINRAQFICATAWLVETARNCNQKRVGRLRARESVGAHYARTVI